MKSKLSSEFMYQVVALFLAVIIVHAIYVGVVRPNADAILEQQLALQAAGKILCPRVRSM